MKKAFVTEIVQKREEQTFGTVGRALCVLVSDFLAELRTGEIPDPNRRIYYMFFLTASDELVRKKFKISLIFLFRVEISALILISSDEIL